MGFFKPRFPDVDPDEFLRKPLMERGRIPTQSWVEYGFPSPRMVHAIYQAGPRARGAGMSTGIVLGPYVCRTTLFADNTGGLGRNE
jgi:Transmembrane protein of unknown function (DUF3556)